MATQASYSPELAPVTVADELAVIVQRAQTFTNASGAATAIREANTGEIICRARSGASAPNVGTPLRTEGTFTGICIRNGEELLCHDAEKDFRVDTSAIRALGIRSIAVVPIKENGRVIGVLAVFASAPRAFSTVHVAMLNALADQISMLLRKERRSKAGGHIEPLVVLPDFSARANASSQVFSQETVALVASDSEASGSTPFFERSTPEAETSQAASAGIVPPILVPEQSERLKEKRESAVFDDKSRISEPQLAVASPLSIDTTGGIFEKRTNSVPKKFIFAGAIAAGLVAAFVTIILLKIASRRSETPAPVVSREDSSIVPTESNQNASYPGPALNTTGSNAQPDNVETGSESHSKRNQRPEKNEQPGKRVPAPLATVALSDSKITMRSGSSDNESQDVMLDPSLSVSSTSDFSLLARPVTTTIPGTVVHSDLVNAKVIRAVGATYPEIARARHMSGRVVMRVIVGRDGKVKNPKFISGPAILRNAALDAVKRWLFKPAMLNGEAIEQETQITVIFNP